MYAQVIAALPVEFFQENVDVVELIFRSIPKDYGQNQEDNSRKEVLRRPTPIIYTQFIYQDDANAKRYVAHVDPSMLLDEKYLELQLKEKERSLDAINSKLSNKVMSNYAAFGESPPPHPPRRHLQPTHHHPHIITVKGMTQIHELGTDLEQSGTVCKDGRQQLARAKNELIQRVLVILAKNKKKQTYTVCLVVDVIDGEL